VNDPSSARPGRSQILLALAPALLAATAAACVPWLRAHRSDLGGSAIWGLVLLASFIGWGGAVGAVLLPGRRLDWGLRSAIGMSFMLALGGLLQLVHLISPATLVAQTLLGLIALAADGFRRRQEFEPRWRQEIARARQAPVVAGAVVALYLLVIGVYLGNLAVPVTNVWDDYEAYFVYPKAMLAWGALEEPFSLRRLGALGGQSLLQSFLLVCSTVWRLNGFDNGICLLSIFGMVHGYTRWRRGAGLVAILLVVGFTYRFHNVASALSGSVFFLALFRVFDGEMSDTLTSRRGPILIGLLSAAAWTLRQNYLVAVLAILGATYAMRWFYDAPARRQLAVGFGRALGALLLFLIPWWIVSYRSSATFLFPFMLGNGRPDFGLLGQISLAQELQFFVFNAFWNHPVRTIVFFVLAALCLDEASKDRSLHAFLIGTGVAVLALIHGLKSLDDVTSISRYYMSFEYALVLAVTVKTLARVSGDDAPVRARSFISAALVIIAVCIQLWDTKDDTAAQWNGSLAQVTKQLPLPFPVPNQPDPKDAIYRRMQATIPEGEKILEILDEPFRLDFRRNRILLCDQPGGAGPKPGLPIHQGPDRYEAYLRDQSIRYIAYAQGPDSPEYFRDRWIPHMLRRDPPVRNGHSRGTLLREMAVFYVDAFDTLTELTRRHRELFHEGSIHVIDLASPPRKP
jgi:hypothetical protein